MPSTVRMNLRRFTNDDVRPLFEVISGEGVFKYFPRIPPVTIELAERMVRSIISHWDQHGFGLWALEDRDTGGLIGRSGLQVIPETGEVEVDFVLDSSHWGRGLATEAAHVALEHGFGILGLDEVVGIVHPDNIASKRVLEKIGMTLNRRTEYFGMRVDHYSAKRVRCVRPPVASTRMIQEERKARDR